MSVETFASIIKKYKESTPYKQLLGHIESTYPHFILKEPNMKEESKSQQMMSENIFDAVLRLLNLDTTQHYEYITLWLDKGRPVEVEVKIIPRTKVHSSIDNVRTVGKGNFELINDKL